MEQKLPKDISYQKLYEPEQNIWFLNWILKQRGCDPYLNHIILSMPFRVKRSYFSNGLLAEIQMFKNHRRHGIDLAWHDNGKFRWKVPLRNDKRHGLALYCFRDSESIIENNWINGHQNQYFM